jgi:hypothetical protein
MVTGIDGHRLIYDLKHLVVRVGFEPAPIVAIERMTVKPTGADQFDRVWQFFLACLSPDGDWKFPVELPLATVIQGREGGCGLGIGGVPTLAGTFQTTCCYFAA